MYHVFYLKKKADAFETLCMCKIKQLRQRKISNRVAEIRISGTGTQ